jgi:DHA2 family multidrug resistance protein
MSASQDQISWVLTTYIVSSAIMMPLTGWLAGHFGVKYIFFASVVGFHPRLGLVRRRDRACSARALPRPARRMQRGPCAAGAGDAVYDLSARHGQAMAIFSTGAMMGPILGPTLEWLAERTSIGVGASISTSRSGHYARSASSSSSANPAPCGATNSTCSALRC